MVLTRNTPSFILIPVFVTDADVVGTNDVVCWMGDMVEARVVDIVDKSVWFKETITLHC